MYITHSHVCVCGNGNDCDETTGFTNNVSLVGKFTDEQYTTINQSTAGRFNPRVFVNCLQVEKCCERRPFIWLQRGDATNACVDKVNTI